MRKYMQAALLSSLVVIAIPVGADMFSPSHSCYKPNKPYQFDDERQLQRFNDDVEEYKRCIADFVDEQNDAVRKHQNAAEEAIDEWNNYARYELQ